MLWQCRRQDPLVSAESVVGRKILLNKLSALTTIFTCLWLYADTVLIWNLMRKWWSQKDSQRRLIMQVSIQIPWGWANGTKRKLSRVTFHTSHLSVAQVTLETNLTSERELVDHDDERLAIKIGDMPPPLPGRVSNPKIRDDQALNDFARTRTRCTVLHLMMFPHKHGLITVDHLSSHTLWENRQRRWAFQRINLPMQHPLQQFGFFQ